jgi:integrase
LEDAVEACKPGDHGRYALKQATKQFFTELCKPRENNGLGFCKNPAAFLKPGSPLTIQNKRRAAGLVLTLDPRPLVTSALPLYWKTFTGLLGFAGLRASEAAGLLWADIDFDMRLIRIRPNEIHPGLKTDPSLRPIRPFPNLWPLLEQLRECQSRCHQVA